MVCLHGTDTALTFTGEAEWLSAGRYVLGIPFDQAVKMVKMFFRARGANPRKVLDGEYTMGIQVCAACVTKGKHSFLAPGIPGISLVPDLSKRNRRKRS